MGEVEEQDIFFVSELAAVARALVTNLSLLVVLAFVLLVLAVGAGTHPGELIAFALP